jgi:hypothetical protein
MSEQVTPVTYVRPPETIKLNVNEIKQTKQDTPANNDDADYANCY